MSFVLGVQCYGNMVLEGTRDIIVPHHVTVTKDTTITGGSIVVVPPMLMYMRTPVTITLNGVNMQNVSPYGLRRYFSMVREPPSLGDPGGEL